MSDKCQRNPFPHQTVSELSGKFGSLQCEGNLTVFNDIEKWHNMLKLSFLTLVPLSILENI